jgi:hypothetical protein
VENNLPNFPLLFDRIGSFLTQFNALRELREKRPTLPPADFVVAFDNLVKGNSPSGADEALAAFKVIVDTVYAASSRGCPSGSTKMPRA